MTFFPSLSSLLVLCVALYPFEEGSTNKSYVLTDSIVKDLGPTVWTHTVPKEMGGVQVA